MRPQPVFVQGKSKKSGNREQEGGAQQQPVHADSALRVQTGLFKPLAASLPPKGRVEASTTKIGGVDFSVSSHSTLDGAVIQQTEEIGNFRGSAECRRSASSQNSRQSQK